MEFRPFKGISNTDEYVTGNKFILLCEKYNIPFAKTDYVFDGLFELKDRIKNGENIKAFVTHQSDYSIVAEHVKHLPDGVTWFADNCEVIGNPNVIGIPNGLNNMDFVNNKTSKWGLYSSCFSNLADFHNDLAEQHSNKKDIRNLVYMNFTPDTSATERTMVYNHFKQKSFVTVEHGVSHKRFANSVYNHPFVLSPRGNGYDCVRTWESFYLGSIPIIKRNNVMSHFSDLPILFVESWEEVTLNLLLNHLTKMKDNVTLDKARMSYWDSILANYATK